MKARLLGSNLLVIVGLLALLIGAVDPLEGALLILPGSGLAALGAGLGQSRHRRLLYWAFTLIAVGVGLMFWLSLIGGLGGDTGRSLGWAFLLLPYPIGWILGLVGTILSLVAAFKHHQA
jgi:hypothetical protein